MLAPGTHTFTLWHGGFDRRYLVRVPPGSPTHAGWPTTLLLHGMGGTADWTLPETGWDRSADELGMVLIVPEALPLHPSVPVAFWKNPTVWNDGGPRGANRSVPIDDVAFLDRIGIEIARRLPLDPRRLYVTGFSNGAAMAFRLVAERADQFAACAPVAGYCRLVEPQPVRAVPTFYLVGEEDPFIPLAGGRVDSFWGWSEERPPLAAMLADWSQALGGERQSMLLANENGLRLERFPHPAVEFTAGYIAGLGHHWPGGRGQLSRRLFGPSTLAVHANRLIGEFFARWSLQA